MLFFQRLWKTKPSLHFSINPYSFINLRGSLVNWHSVENPSPYLLQIHEVDYVRGWCMYSKWQRQRGDVRWLSDTSICSSNMCVFVAATYSFCPSTSAYDRAGLQSAASWRRRGGGWRRARGEDRVREGGRLEENQVAGWTQKAVHVFHTVGWVISLGTALWMKQSGEGHLQRAAVECVRVGKRRGGEPSSTWCLPQILSMKVGGGRRASHWKEERMKPTRYWAARESQGRETLVFWVISEHHSFFIPIFAWRL